MGVNEYLSDLFFNHNVDPARRPESQGGGYDPDLLQGEAEDFLASIKGFCRSIGCSTGAVFPSSEDLTSDFLDRI